jgi:hypothetical protein
MQRAYQAMAAELVAFSPGKPGKRPEQAQEVRVQIQYIDMSNILVNSSWVHAMDAWEVLMLTFMATCDQEYCFCFGARLEGSMQPQWRERRSEAFNIWVVQDMDEYLSTLGSTSSKVMKEWQDFFHKIEELEKKTSVGAKLAAGRACKHVLKAMLFAGEVAAPKSLSNDHAYGDVTQWLRNLGEFACDLGVAKDADLKLKGEAIQEKLVTSRHTMKCTRCTNGVNHLNSMCFVKKKTEIRERSRQEDYAQRPRDERDRYGGFRGESNNRQRKRSPPRYGRGY